MKISTLFTDIGGVFLTNGWDHHSRELAVKTFNLDPKEFESRHQLNVDVFEIGKMSLDEYLRRVVFYETRSFTPKDFKEFIFAQSKPFDEMINLLKKIKREHGLKIGALSNESMEINRYRIETFKLHLFIDFFISSSSVGLRKPDPEIYKLALNVAMVLPQEAIYIDDRELFAEMGETFGMHSIHHTSFETTQKRLFALL